VQSHYCFDTKINFIEVLNRIDIEVNPPKQDLDAYTRDFLTNSFLIRKGDLYKFSHTSIQEYLVALQADCEIKKNKPEIFGRCNLSYVILGFLKELSPNTDNLFGWIGSTTKPPFENLLNLGGNAASLLNRIDNSLLSNNDFSNSILINADLTNADLRGTNLNKANLKDTNLTLAKFYKEDIDGALFDNTRITFYSIHIDGVSKTKGKYSSEIDSILIPRFEKMRLDDYSKYEFGMGYRMMEGTHNFRVHLSLNVPKNEDVQQIREKLSDSLKEEIYFYYDEIEKHNIA
jgi:uncharacterized protein YjbI with pentapeptide repeats